MSNPERSRQTGKTYSRNVTDKQRVAVYVTVDSVFDPSGAVKPISIIWKDGRVFPIEEVVAFRPASTLQPPRCGDYYDVKIRGEIKRLFFRRTNAMERCRLGRWWVEVVDSDNGSANTENFKNDSASSGSTSSTGSIGNIDSFKSSMNTTNTQERK